MRNSFVFIIACLVFIINGCTRDTLPLKKSNVSSCDTMNISFSNDLLPIFNANCNSSGCHGSGSTNGDFTGYNGINAKVLNGSLNNRVLVLQDMPPSGPLNAVERDKINCWINKGAPNN